MSSYSVTLRALRFEAVTFACRVMAALKVALVLYAVTIEPQDP